jgi:hypothetical protein
VRVTDPAPRQSTMCEGKIVSGIPTAEIELEI